MFVDLHLLLQRATTPFNLERIILLCFRMLEFESLLPFDLCVAKHTSLAFIIFRLRSQGKHNHPAEERFATFAIRVSTFCQFNGLYMFSI